MRAANPGLAKTCFNENAVLQTIIKDSLNATRVVVEPLDAFTNSLGSLETNDADERLAKPVIQVDGNLASVWVPYQFFYKGKFSHCGVNSFQLVHTKQGWLIQYIIDTRRKKGCL